jgi:PII-like signaling protein
MALRVYTRQSAHTRGGALYTNLTRRLRAAGAAGATTVRGEWGFSSDEKPFGDRLGTLASHVPTYTVVVDRPRRIAELWPIVDELTAEHGVVTAAIVPAYRERAAQVENGRLRVPAPDELLALYRGAGERSGAPGPAATTPLPAAPVTPEDHWVLALVAQIAGFAASHQRPRPLVRVSLADGEQFFLASVEPRPGAGFVTLHPHSPQLGHRAGGREEAALVARSLVVPLSGVAKIEMLNHVPRGTRSDVGFILP